MGGAPPTTLGGELAVKFLAREPAHEGEDPATAMARFRFEAQVAARLSRKTRHIVAVTDHGEEWGYAYLVMELVEGESLESRMRRCGRLSPAELAPIVTQIAKGLAHAHAEGVFHRDLKPANVLLTRDEDGELLVKILDFGIAKAARSHKVTQHETGHSTEVGIVLGTPNYMSPEQARGLSTLDHRCDLWALAVVAYEALTGALPYDGETTADLLVNVCSAEPLPIAHFRPDLPVELDELFSRAFAAQVSDRFQDATSLAAAFAAIADPAIAELPVPLVARSGAQPAAELPPMPVAPAPVPALASASDSVAERGVSGPIEVPLERPRRAGLLALAAAAVVAVIVIAVRMSSTSPVAETRAATPAPSEAKVAASSHGLEPPPKPEPPAPTASAAPSSSASSAVVAPKTKLPKKPEIAKPQPAAAPEPKPWESPAPPPPPKPVDKGEIF